MQPVVILGGFLITDEAYGPMAQWLKAQGGLDVSVVHASRVDWLLTSSTWGWQRLLQRVDHSVKQARDRCAGAPVTLIGHSSGGVMLRLYLAEHGLEGASLNGQKLCDRLISLGSPHQAKRATRLRALVDRLHPGCACAPQVDYVSVAGRLDLSSAQASGFARRSAANSYRQIGAQPEDPGDGLVPVSSAWLKDSRLIELEATAHGGLFGQPWYGSIERLSQWWPQAMKKPPP